MNYLYDEKVEDIVSSIWKHIAVINRVRLTTLLKTKDEENVMVMLDEVMANEARHLAPHFSTMSVDRPYQISKFITILPQSDTTISNMLSSKRDLPGKDTIVSKLSFIEV